MTTRPTSDPVFATDSAYPAGADPWSAQSNKNYPGGVAFTGFIPEQPMAADHMNYELNSHGSWIKFLDSGMRLKGNWATWSRAIAANDAYAGDFHVSWTGGTAAALQDATSTFNQPHVRLANPLVAGPDSSGMSPDKTCLFLTSSTVASFTVSVAMSSVGANNNVILFGLVGAGPGAWFTKASADTNWKCVTDDGASTTTTTTTPPVAGTPQFFRIEAVGTGTPTVYFYIDESLVATHTTHIPTASALKPYLLTQASANNAVTFDVGTIQANW